MTEEEARRKWCPMVRHTYQEEVSANRANHPLNESPLDGGVWNKCIASGCMMWRATEDQHIGQIGDIKTYKTGYCSLAGKP